MPEVFNVICPLCKECPFTKGVCEQRILRGRRFFLMGALALPAAVQIARVAPLITPVYEAPKLTRLPMRFHMSTIKLVLRDGSEVTYAYPDQIEDAAMTMNMSWGWGSG